MTKIISFISRKGGTGKTTSAIHFATMLHSLGHSLVMLETDTNYTLTTLRKMELYKTGAKESAVFPIIGSEDHKVLADIEKIKDKSPVLKEMLEDGSVGIAGGMYDVASGEVEFYHKP
jgi:chromosome partitioning protein